MPVAAGESVPALPQTFQELVFRGRDLWFWEPPYGQGVIISLAIFFFGLILLLVHYAERFDEERLHPKASGAREPKPVLTSSSKPSRPLYIPLTVGNVVIDLQPTMDGTIHTIIDGASGFGKSTLLVQLLELPIGVVFLSLDNCRPIQRRIDTVPDGIHWTNERDWPLGLDLTGGPADIAAEGIVAGFPKTGGDKGTYRRYASERIEKAYREMDAAGKRRNLGYDVVEMLLKGTKEVDADRACASWAPRIRGLANHLGSSLGHDIDIGQAMRDRRKLLLRVNRFRRPEWAPFVGGMLLVHLRRAIDEVDVPFVVVVEEAGQLEEFQDLMSPIGQAARDRGKPLIVLTQNPSLLPREVTNNAKVWISFPHEDKAEAANMAHHLRLNQDQLLIEAFPAPAGAPEKRGVGWCYVRAPGVDTRLVKVAEPPAPKRVPVQARYSSLSTGTPPEREQEIEEAEEPEETKLPEPVALVPRRDEEAPPWVMVSELTMRMWPQCEWTWEPTPLWQPERGLWWDERGCLRWKGSMTSPRPGKPSRPRISLGKKDYTPYREVVRAMGGNPNPTVDHLCGHPWCVEHTHLEGGVDIVENQVRNEPRRIAFELAWSMRSEEKAA